MKERPIIMTAESSKSIQRDENPKTQTRRVVTCRHFTPPDNDCVVKKDYFKANWPAVTEVSYVDLAKEWRCYPEAIPNRRHGETYTLHLGSLKSPYGQPGDRLWVKETWTTRQGLDTTKPSDISHNQSIGYIADDEGPWLGKIRSPIHMPRWASRITLEVTEVRVERVTDISIEDVYAEGIYQTKDGWQPGGYCGSKAAFRELWDSINGQRKVDGQRVYCWGRQPYVWVVTFKMLKGESA